MRDLLVSHIPDPGALVLLVALALLAWTVFRMATYREPGDPVEHDPTPLPPADPIDPETDARTRGF